ncbi:hypothetical protein, conserved [Babesia bigemina]|uniref:Uncharacterized protein n=1 Tax=Babesia bigemina TaxID=5866 RepID=A0A061DC99_BABBI|nr:hypothetical protein, conserved [Babesia bigemina]CDR97677.1 hypothetical protein, conserved [Babesia bigemina]|eukprot:XP_012769863.1 hypothetical protein, conserved [Babesia bigemina]
MMVKVRHVLAAAVLIPAVILSADAPYYLQDTPTHDVLKRAYAVATVGLLRHCVKVSKYIEESAPATLNRRDTSSVESMANDVNRAILNVAAMFGVTEYDLHLGNNTVSDMEVVLKGKELPAHVDFKTIYEQVKSVLDRCKIFSNFMEKLLRRKNEEGDFKLDHEDIDDRILIEFPKIWIGPLHMVYKSLNLNSRSIEPGEILGARLQLWGAEEFKSTFSAIERVIEDVSFYYPQLFQKRANELIQKMWDEILANKNEENSEAIDALYKLSTMNEHFRIVS